MGFIEAGRKSIADVTCAEIRARPTRPSVNRSESTAGSSKLRNHRPCESSASSKVPGNFTTYMALVRFTNLSAATPKDPAACSPANGALRRKHFITATAGRDGVLHPLVKSASVLTFSQKLLHLSQQTREIRMGTSSNGRAVPTSKR
jgi:hypothetical protein